MWNESIGKKLHTLKLYVKVILMNDKSQNFIKIKELQFNVIANAAHCHPPTVRLTQSLSNNKLGLLFGFFNAPQLTCASTRRCVALKKPLTFVRGFVARPGFEPGTSGL
jgi:hypothetical protein